MPPAYASMNRRDLLKLLALVSFTGLPGCDRNGPNQDQYAKFSPPAFSHENLHRLLDALLSAYENKGMRVGDTLLPAVTESNLIKQCQWFPGDLTPELVSLYAWRGGQEKDAWNTEFPFWFRDNSFCSIQRAKSEYHSLMQTYGSILWGEKWLKYAFPIAAFNGGWYVIPTRGQPFSQALKTPIISVMEGIDIFFYSIETMVHTCLDWVRHEDYGHKQALPAEVEMEIWRKHNPGIFMPGA